LWQAKQHCGKAYIAKALSYLKNKDSWKKEKHEGPAITPHEISSRAQEIARDPTFGPKWNDSSSKNFMKVMSWRVKNIERVFNNNMNKMVMGNPNPITYTLPKNGNEFHHGLMYLEFMTRMMMATDKTWKGPLFDAGPNYKIGHFTIKELFAKLKELMDRFNLTPMGAAAYKCPKMPKK